MSRSPAAVRRAARWLTLVVVLAPVMVLTYRCYEPSKPDRAEAARIVEGFSGQLLAYEIIEGIPTVVFLGRLNRVTFDHLRRDPISIN